MVFNTQISQVHFPLRKQKNLNFPFDICNIFISPVHWLNFILLKKTTYANVDFQNFLWCMYCNGPKYNFIPFEWEIIRFRIDLSSVRIGRVAFFQQWRSLRDFLALRDRHCWSFFFLSCHSNLIMLRVR